MIQHLAGGSWTMPSRRLMEAGTRTLPLMALLFVPIYLKLDTIYVWAKPGAMDADPVLHSKAAYLNPQFFLFRAVLFFAIWTGLTYILNKWSREQDQEPPQPIGPKDRRSRMVSGPGLVLYVATITFMSVDWVMSLDPHWYSTIFGVLTLGGQGLSTLAFTIVVLASLVQFKPMSQVATANTFHDHGKLMFAFLMLWAYFSVSQLLIIWSANLPEEIPFYLQRLNGPWYPISVLVLVGQFMLPFSLLLSQSFKRNPNVVKWIALLILVMRIVDITWTIGPVFRHEGSSISWVDFAAALGIGGLWLVFFFRNLGSRSLLAARDPYFKDAIANGGH
jgi:hypothetical protein